MTPNAFTAADGVIYAARPTSDGCDGVHGARQSVGAFVGARAEQVVFTKNATEAINLVALAIGHASQGRSAARGGGPAAADDPARRLIIGEGDEVVVTNVRGIDARGPEKTIKKGFGTKDATGHAPLAYLQTLRLEKAKELLESTRLTFELITSRVGYEDSNSFRRLFCQRVGVSPAAFRKRFQRLPDSSEHGGKATR